MEFTPVQKVSAYEGIVRQIEAAVADGNLKVGDRLPSERKLMEDFSVSRATVREALRVLQATGVVESRQGDPRGPIISPYSTRLLEKSMSQLARLDSVSRLELIQFRLLVEGSASFLAANLHTAEQLTDIETALTALVDGVDRDGASNFDSLVAAFHTAIRSASGNRLLAVCGQVVSGVMSELVVQRISSDADSRALVQRSAQDGTELVQAIRHRDASLARNLQVRNIYRFYVNDLDPAERTALDGLAAPSPNGV